MTHDHDVFTAHYRELKKNQIARSRLVADPARGLREHFGSVPEGAYRIEVVPQDPGTITILLPAPPPAWDGSDTAIEEASGRIYDILFTDGVGGYFIPDDALTWVLRDMRSRWLEDSR
jgi:hypothetical protein